MTVHEDYDENKFFVEISNYEIKEMKTSYFMYGVGTVCLINLLILLWSSL